MLDPALAPFTISLLLMAMIAVLEIIGALFGAAPSSLLEGVLPDFDLDADADADFDAPEAQALGADAPHIPNAPAAGPLSQILSWLCVGRVPILVLLVAFLTGFGVAGVVLQTMVKGVFGAYAPSALMVVPAFLLALPATRSIGLGLSMIMPKEETDAVSEQRLIGRVATIIRGEAKRGLPAEAKLNDLKGQTHYILVEPDIDTDVFVQGTEVLVVQKSGAVYRGIPNDHPSLRSSA